MDFLFLTARKELSQEGQILNMLFVPRALLSPLGDNIPIRANAFPFLFPEE